MTPIWHGDTEDLEREVRELRCAIWCSLRLIDSGREAQGVNALRRALPDDYRPVGA